MNKIRLKFIKKKKEKDDNLELLKHLINIPENLIKIIEIIKEPYILLNILINYNDIDKMEINTHSFFNFSEDYIQIINKLFTNSVIYKNDKDNQFYTYIYSNLKKKININSLKSFILNDIKHNDRHIDIIFDTCNISKTNILTKIWYNKIIKIEKRYDFDYKKKISYNININEQNKNKQIFIDLYIYDNDDFIFVYNLNNEIKYIYDVSYLNNNSKIKLLINKISNDNSYIVKDFTLKNDYKDKFIDAVLLIIKKEIEMKERYVNIEKYINNIFNKISKEEKITWNI